MTKSVGQQTVFIGEMVHHEDTINVVAQIFVM